MFKVCNTLCSFKVILYLSHSVCYLYLIVSQMATQPDKINVDKPLFLALKTYCPCIQAKAHSYLFNLHSTFYISTQMFFLTFKSIYLSKIYYIFPKSISSPNSSLLHLDPYLSMLPHKPQSITKICLFLFQTMCLFAKHSQILQTSL